MRTWLSALQIRFGDNRHLVCTWVNKNSCELYRPVAPVKKLKYVAFISFL